jgi:CBS domain-containing protein
MNVVELMLSPVHTCLKQDNLARASQIMWEHDCGALPVLDDLGDPVAMITDRDICMAAYTQGKPLSEIQVTTAASHHLASVPPDDSVEFALSLMAKHQVHRLPVVDRGGNLIGVVSFADIVRSQCSLDEGVAERTFEQLARTLEDVCRRHGETRGSARKDAG